jgi:hypothetical protein
VSVEPPELPEDAVYIPARAMRTLDGPQRSAHYVFLCRYATGDDESGGPQWSAPHFTADQIRAYGKACYAAEMERAATLCDMKPSEILLMAGEMTAPEMRSVRAVLGNRATAIRALNPTAAAPSPSLPQTE